MPQEKEVLRRFATAELPRDQRSPGAGIIDSVRLASRFRHFDRFTVAIGTPQGKLTLEREVLRSGPVVGVLPIDVDRQEIVLIRQFRLAGHLARDLGEMVEIVAGRVDAGESSEEAASRECREEIGVIPRKLVPLFDFAPAPALTDEFMQLFLARVDAAATPRRAGLCHEGEDITVIRFPLARVTELLDRNHLHSGPALLALHWLAANMAKIEQLLR